MMTDAEILNKAADYLMQYGWTQYNFVGEDGRSCCAYAAIHCYAKERTLGVVRRVERLTGESIVLWNDAPGRTLTEVVTTLRKAAVT